MSTTGSNLLVRSDSRDKLGCQGLVNSRHLKALPPDLNGVKAKGPMQ